MILYEDCGTILVLLTELLIMYMYLLLLDLFLQVYSFELYRTQIYILLSGIDV